MWASGRCVHSIYNDMAAPAKDMETVIMKHLNRNSKTAFICILAGASLTLSACANSGANTIPIIDAPNSAQLQTDLAQCQQLAAQRDVLNNNTLGTAVAGAGFGALVGSSFGGRFGDRGRGENALAGALAGAAAGTGVGVIQGQNDQADIVYRCMRGRGYRILG